MQYKAESFTHTFAGYPTNLTPTEQSILQNSLQNEIDTTSCVSATKMHGSSDPDDYRSVFSCLNSSRLFAKFRESFMSVNELGHFLHNALCKQTKKFM